MQDRVLRSSEVPNQSSTTLTETTPPIRQRGWGLIVFKAVLSMVCCSAIICTYSAIVVPPFVQAADQDNILLDFSATWCGPCRQMSPIVSKLERQGFPIRKVDVDVEKELSRQFNVASIPCFVLIANGQEINRITGATDEKELRRLMALLPKKNLDDAIELKANQENGLTIPVTKSAAKSTKEKKPFLKIPPLFAKNQEKNKNTDRDFDLTLTPTNAPDTVRGQNPGSGKFNGYSSDPLAASTRIRVKDGTRIHFGSGTIIESQPGRSFILTCGHIFRDLGKDATVEVDLFDRGTTKLQTVGGENWRFDLKADIGLVEIPTKQSLPSIKLAVQGPPAVRDRVVSIGCGGGDLPTREEHVVTAINKYHGPDNVECNGVPQQGRSGGGLFLGSELVGVCIAADPRDKRGIYTGMKPVLELLRKSNLGHLAPSLVSTDETLADSGSREPGTSLGSAVGLADDSPRRSDDEVARLLEGATRGSAHNSTGSGDYIGSEIVCIVRPKTPGAMSRIVIVNQASSRFVDDLLYESNRRGQSETASVSNTSHANKLVNHRPSQDSLARATHQEIMKSSEDRFKNSGANRPIETSYEPQRYRRNRD